MKSLRHVNVFIRSLTGLELAGAIVVERFVTHITLLALDLRATDATVAFLQDIIKGMVSVS